MSEIDLIPVRYARRLRTRVGLIRLGLAFLVSILILVGGRLALDHANARYSAEIDALAIERERLSREHEELETLRGLRTGLAERLVVLESIRGDDAATRMFEVVDDSLNEHVRFSRWVFSRADEIVDEQERAVESGYFIVLPRTHADEPERTWRRHTHMEISASAADHTALAGFVRRLSKSPEIDQARILNTHTRRDAEASDVEFELAVTVGRLP